MSNSDLQLAIEMADAADAITMRHFRGTFSIRMKDDHTPVSEVDEAVERMIRARLQRDRPGDEIVGEEYGRTAGSQPADSRRWIIDPIDATKNYIRGIPIFATLIALDEKVGVISAPALQRRWTAARGEGAFCNGFPIHVSQITSIEDAHLGYDSITEFPNEKAFVKLVHRCARTRAFGDFWNHMLVAEGAIDIAVEPVVAWWDMAAVRIIVEEAGGRFSDLAGEARADGGSGVSTNGRLHDEVLAALAKNFE